MTKEQENKLSEADRKRPIGIGAFKQPFTIVCPDCGGQGEEHTTSYTEKRMNRKLLWRCSTCKGTGKVTVKIMSEG